MEEADEAGSVDASIEGPTDSSGGAEAVEIMCGTGRLVSVEGIGGAEGAGNLRREPVSDSGRAVAGAETGTALASSAYARVPEVPG